NPLANLFTRSNIAYSILYAAIAAPIVEELIFRKFLLNKLRRYGDVPAILITAFAFGLFHMNLAQFFYAMALGIIFAYVTIRTNTVRYSILLHIMINAIGTAVAPLAVKTNIIFSSIIVMWVFGVIAAGVVILILNIKKIRLYKAACPLEKKSDYFLNAGTILYTLMCLVMIVIATVS
ncbi:MAG TPA: CPBP family intramembrane glutamic endopeptidase, partial [Lachnospiraceae bacterium]|nr:CPBP family intramembrane glutamic endopeptidase [Lachnospiraceae bacterium]